MELLFLWLLLLILTPFLSIAFGLILSPRKFYARRRKNLPPGKMGWPIVGETIEFGSTLRKGIPEKFVADRMAKYSPDVFKTSLIGEPVVVLCGSAGHKFLSSNENKLVAIWFPPAVAKVFPRGQNTP